VLLLCVSVLDAWASIVLSPTAAAIPRRAVQLEALDAQPRRGD